MRSVQLRPYRIVLSLAWALLLGRSPSASAQTVSTYLPFVQNAMGISADGIGNLYIGSRTTPNGVVYRCTPPSTILTTLAFVADPVGVVCDGGSGTVYIADNLGNRILKVPAAGGPSAVLASVPNPGWLALDGSGNVYVAQFAGQTIFKVTPTGLVSVYVSGFPFPAPGLGPISMGGGGVLYAATYGGAVYSVAPGGLPVTPFATLPACGSLTPGPGGTWYAGTYNHETIDQIGPSGSPVTIFVGMDLVPGHVDGPLASATFNGINGIVWLDPNDLYVAESGNNDIRQISLSATPTRASSWGRLKALYR